MTLSLAERNRPEGLADAEATDGHLCDQRERAQGRGVT
jgi:hypothetical protein